MGKYVSVISGLKWLKFGCLGGGGHLLDTFTCASLHWLMLFMIAMILRYPGMDKKDCRIQL